MLLLAFALLLPLAQQPDEVFLQCGKSAARPALSQAGEGGIARCVDGAVVTYQDMRFEADWIEYVVATKQVSAGDKVRFVRDEEELDAGRVSFNLDTKTGTFTDASGQIEGYFVKTSLAERLPDGKWRFTRPTATACTGECPTWRFDWKEASVGPGKNVSGKGMVLRFRNIPVLWVPRFSIPTEKKERSSGFLIPVTSNSTTKGRSLRQSYYWAPSRSYDATLTGEYFTKRGPAGAVDFRAAPNASTRLDISTFFAFDRKKQGGHRTHVGLFTDFGENWRGVANVDIISDFGFRQVYEEGFNVISSPIEQSIAYLSNNQPRSSLNVLYNRSAIFFPDQPTVALRKFPAVDYQIPTNSIAQRIPVYFSLEAGFAGMARRDGRIETPAWVQRGDFHPKIDIPLVRGGVVTWSHHVSLRDTYYTHSLNSNTIQRPLNRATFEYSTKITGPQLARNFKTFTHLIEPDVEYRVVRGVDRFLQTIVVDETDLITDTNEIEYGITNRFMAGHEFLSWRVAQKMYFDPTFGGALQDGRRNALAPLMDLTGFAFSDGAPRRFSPIVSTVRIATTPQSSTDIEVDYDAKREEFRSAGIMGGINRGLVNSSIGYFFNRRTEIQSANNQLRGLVSIGSQQRLGLSGGFGFNYDIHRRLFQGATTQVVYNSSCYGLSFEFTQYDLGARKESRLRFSLSLKNIGSFGTLRPQERLF